MHVCKRKKVFFRKSENHEKPATFRQKSAIFLGALRAKKKDSARAARGTNQHPKNLHNLPSKCAVFPRIFLGHADFFFQNGGEYFMENHRLWCKTFNNNSGQEQRETWKFLFSSSWSVLDCDPLPTTNMASEYDLIVPCTYLFKFVFRSLFRLLFRSFFFRLFLCYNLTHYLPWTGSPG